MTFQLVIPAYNEADSLQSMVKRTVQAAERSGWNADRFQLIIINNGSTDNSESVLKTLMQGTHAPWLKIVQIEKNKGYGDGIYNGLKASTAAYVGWTHADEQCDPADAFVAVQKLMATKNPSRTIVKGRRRNRRAFDFVWSRFFELAVLLVLRVCIWEINAQPKVFSRNLLKELTNPPDDFAFDLYVLYRARRAGWDIKTIPVSLAPRAHGESRWAFNFKSRWKTSMKMFGYIRALAGESR